MSMLFCARPSCATDRGIAAPEETPENKTCSANGYQDTGLVETEIYTTDDGFVAIEQPNNTVVLLSVDQLLAVIRELQACYDDRSEWQEPARE
jgi:hypothetical protein